MRRPFFDTIMNNPRRGGGPRKGTDRPAAREGRSSARPSFSRTGGAAKGFSKDRFVSRAAGEDNDRPSRGTDRPNTDRPFNRDRPQGDRPFNRDRPQGDRPFNRDRPQGDRPFNRDRPQGDRPFNRDRPERGGDRPFNRDRPERGGDRPFNRDRPQGDRPFNRDRPQGDRPFNRDRPQGDRPFNRDRSQGDRPFNRDRPQGDRPFNRDRPQGDRPERNNDRPRNDRPNYSRDNSYGEQKRNLRGGSDRPAPRRDDDRPRRDGDRPRTPGAFGGGEGRKPKSFTDNAVRREQECTRRRADEVDNEPLEETDGKIRLNKFIAAAGVCSRREADRYIEDGRIAVNGKTVTELGFKVNPDDEVRLGGRLLRPEKHVYILLNKPKNYITSLDDEEGRQTVMDLIGNTINERVYPVGRLDRNTTGLLLLTNDGDLAERLMHPSFEIRKVYQVELDRPISEQDADRIRKGLMLEDGKASVDDMAILTPDRKSIGLEIHIGRNRIVRRIFEALDYTVVKLDRVMYGGLTKKDLPRGKFRALSSQEIINIKHLGVGKKGGRS